MFIRKLTPVKSEFHLPFSFCTNPSATSLLAFLWIHFFFEHISVSVPLYFLFGTLVTKMLTLACSDGYYLLREVSALRESSICPFFKSPVTLWIYYFLSVSFLGSPVRAKILSVWLTALFSELERSFTHGSHSSSGLLNPCLKVGSESRKPHLKQYFYSVVPGPAVSASLEKLLAVQILGPPTSPVKSESGRQLYEFQQALRETG